MPKWARRLNPRAAYKVQAVAGTIAEVLAATANSNAPLVAASVPAILEVECEPGVFFSRSEFVGNNRGACIAN